MSAAVIALLSAVLTAGCGSPTDPVSSGSSSAPSRPVADSFSIVWESTPALNLLSSEGVFVRAVMESTMRTSIRGVGASTEFPGFARVPTGQFAIDYQDTYLKPSNNGVSRGTFSYRVAKVQRPTPATATFTICESTAGWAGFHDNAWRTQVGSIVDTYTLTIHKTGTTPPPANVSGRYDRPAIDVFGSWHVPVFEFGSTEEKALCPQPASPKPAQIVDGPPPNLPPQPGWPGHAP